MISECDTSRLLKKEILETQKIHSPVESTPPVTLYPDIALLIRHNFPQKGYSTILMSGKVRPNLSPIPLKLGLLALRSAVIYFLKTFLKGFTTAASGQQ
jgi:hypothetical protein